MLSQEWVGNFDSLPQNDKNKIQQQEYDDKISRVKTHYLKMWQVIQKLNSKLDLASSSDSQTRAIYEDLTTELKFSLLNGFEQVNFRCDESVGLHSSQELSIILF